MLVGLRILFRFSQVLPSSRDTQADAAASGRPPGFDSAVWRSPPSPVASPTGWWARGGRW